jgi:hypothetical protein
VDAAVSARASFAERRNAERGFTVLELAVATLVLLVAVMIAADLLTESGRLLHHSARRARDPWPAFATERLRNDLRSARTYPPVIEWQDTPLVLESAGDSVVWGRGPEDELLRADGTEAPFALLRGVRRFRWRAPGGGALEVWITYEESSPFLSQLTGALPHSDPGREREIHLLVVGRGDGTYEW